MGIYVDLELEPSLVQINFDVVQLNWAQKVQNDPQSPVT